MKTGTILAALTLTVIPATIALAQESTFAVPRDRYSHYEGRRDRFYLNIGTVVLHHDTVDELNARGFAAGTVIDWEKEFGLPSTTGSFRAEAYFRLAPRHRFRASYFTTSRASNQRSISGEIQWGDLTIPLDVRLNAEWNTRVIRGDYRFSVIQRDRVDVGLAIGLYLLRVQSNLRINDSSLQTAVSQSAPLPMIGADVEWDVARHLLFRGGFQLLGVKIGDQTKVDGNWAEIRAALEWMPTRNFGFGVGYLYSDVSVDIAFGSGVLSNWTINYNTGGATIYALASF